MAQINHFDKVSEAYMIGDVHIDDLDAVMEVSRAELKRQTVLKLLQALHRQ